MDSSSSCSRAVLAVRRRRCSRQRRVRLVRGCAFRQVGATVGELVGRRVEVLELQQVVGQHRMTVLVSGVEGSGTRGSSTSGGIVVPLSMGTRRETTGEVMTEPGATVDAVGVVSVGPPGVVSGGGGGGGCCCGAKRNPAGAAGARRRGRRHRADDLATADDGAGQALVARQVQPGSGPGVRRRRLPVADRGERQRRVHVRLPDLRRVATALHGVAVAPSNSGTFSIGV